VPAATGAPGSTRLPVAITPPPALSCLSDQELRLTIDRFSDLSVAMLHESAVFEPSDAPTTCEMMYRARASADQRILRAKRADLHKCVSCCTCGCFCSQPGHAGRIECRHLLASPRWPARSRHPPPYATARRRQA